jgi:cellulose synthase/poly-beta-1,6-N-acetylglucosamine synthase-like glycosyltransferase
MLESILTLLTLLAGALVVYHHLGYPLILRWLGRARAETPPPAPERAYREAEGDSKLPSIAVLIPAFNEAEHIADKIRNLAAIDYPSGQLRVVLACDGCTDNTADIAWATAREPECADLPLEILEFRQNRGKVALLNKVMPSFDGDLVALSDVSALVSVDALLVAANRFEDPRVGVVSGSYRLFNPGGSGELDYWAYQSAIKLAEGSLGSTLGAHGAFYVLRRKLFEPLEPDTINDDFVLPMRVVSRGYRALYEPRINALELESANLDLDRCRRHRIAAGNLQQLVRLRGMLRPSLKGVAFAFASGKGLRALMPFFLLFLLLGSAVLAPTSGFFALLVATQLFIYGAAAFVQLRGTHRVSRELAAVHYFVQGHVAGLVGALRYLTGRERGAWRRANLSIGDNP